MLEYNLVMSEMIEEPKKLTHNCPNIDRGILSGDNNFPTVTMHSEVMGLNILQMKILIVGT